MSAVLNEIVDPRGPLERARRIELYRFARDNGITEITEAMPADVMRHILRGRGVTHINVPRRDLGTTEPTFTAPDSHRVGSPDKPQQPAQIAEVDATADLVRQWQAQKPVKDMNITERRKEAKRRGIKLARTDNMATLEAKLNGV